MENIVERGRPQMAIWRMCVACWVTNSRDTHSEYVILIDLQLQQWLNERASMLGDTYNDCTFYMQKSNILSNLFLQFVVLSGDGRISPKLCRI
jgi:hypothetical protein